MNWNDYFTILQNVSTRYFFIAGIAFLIGYVLFRKWVRYKKIQTAVIRKQKITYAKLAIQ